MDLGDNPGAQDICVKTREGKIVKMMIIGTSNDDSQNKIFATVRYTIWQ
jgi:hypothetical protein